ncbi:MAG: hypothetical protein HKN04_14790 [Rhodothermaceae bacterium]|nr:hypothetical protein [Rhodothermaceae bacterium]
MNLATFIAQAYAFSLVVYGLSHLFHPTRWAALFLGLRDRPEGGLLIGLLTLPLGLLMVAGHNIWVLDFPVLITVAGWLTLIKGTIYVLAPQTFLRASPVSHEVFVRGFRKVGVVMTVLGVVLLVDAVVG